MSSSPHMADCSPPSSTFSTSILRPSVLANKIQTTTTSAIQPAPESAPKMVKPLVEAPTFNHTSLNSTGTEPTNAPDFVFGQNMISRVVNAHHGASENIWEAAKQDDTSGAVFTKLAKAVTKSTESKTTEHLEDSAVALARKRDAARILLTSTNDGEPHEITTGEENERTVMELTCSAYIFNRDAKQWMPIGQSYLHLNDNTKLSFSRLVVRLQSTHRVVVNTRIWAEMPVAYVAESKAVRVGAIAMTDQSEDENAIRTYMLRFASVNSAHELYQALKWKREQAENSATVAVKRVRSENPQTPVDNSESSSRSSCESEVRPTASVNQPPLPRHIMPTRSSVGSKTGAATVLSLPCRRVRFYDALGALVEDTESNCVSVQITDYPPYGPSILEVTAPIDGGESLVTVAVGFRLAFCRVGDAEVQIYVVSTSAEDQKVEEGKLEKYFRIQLASTSAADRFYQCILLRASRLFMESSGVLKEPEESSSNQAENPNT